MRKIISDAITGILICCSAVSAEAASVIEEAVLQQNWVKHGVVLEPGFAGPQSAKFLSAPSVVRLKNGRLRMYVWTADDIPPWLRGRHIIMAVEADPVRPLKWEPVTNGAMIGPDPANRLRDIGVGFPYVLPRSNGPWFMYYSSWSSSWLEKQEMTNRSGLALSHDQGLSWQIINEDLIPSGPAGSFDSGAIPSVAVLPTSAGDYEMWYTAAGKYVPFGPVNQGILHLGAARSSDGIRWEKTAGPAMLALEGETDPYEACLARPAVLKLDGVYHMWFGVYEMAPGSKPTTVKGERVLSKEDGLNRKPNQGGRYHIEYAYSHDGINWVRYLDQPIMPVTPGAFDSHSQTYASVVDMGDEIWMFYTGDGLGTTGIGLATLDKAELGIKLKQPTPGPAISDGR